MAKGRHVRRDPRGPTTLAFGVAVLLVAGLGGRGNASPPATGDEPVVVAPTDEPLPPVVRQPLTTAAAPVSQRAVRAALELPLSGAPYRGLPRVALQAYQRAAVREAALRPSCHLTWPLLAGIGFIESGHAHGHGSESSNWDGIARPGILGPVLDGRGFAAIADTDKGRYDGNGVWDRAVGPMQFLPSTWHRWGVDADGDHVANPEDIFDASAAAGDYLCAAGGDLSSPDGITTAVFAYNHSTDYVRAVVTAAQYYGGPTPVTISALATLPTEATGTHATARPAVTPSARPAVTSRPVPQPVAWPTPATTPSAEAAGPSSPSPSPAESTPPPTSDPETPAPTGTESP